jgi:hypothetical protein
MLPAFYYQNTLIHQHPKGPVFSGLKFSALVLRQQNMKTFRNALALSLLLALSGCAHSYYYLPEIAGEGAMQGNKGSVTYSIPPSPPTEVLMRIRSFGIRKVKGVPMIGMRLSFVRPQGVVAAREFLKPEELILQFGDVKIKPAYIYTKARKDAVIELSAARNVVELLYPLPNDYKNEADVEIFKFRWTLLYGKQLIASQTTRFDRKDAAPQQAGSLFPNDPFYPYDYGPLDMPGWEVSEDPFWWPMNF